MTLEELRELRNVVAQVFAAETDPSRKQELQKQREFLRDERDRLLELENNAVVAQLEGPIQRVELIVADLQREDIRSALNRIQERLGLKRLPESIVPSTESTPAEPATLATTPLGATDTATDVAASVLVPADWMPDADMRKVVCHWTGGNYHASDLEKQKYHILVQGDGTLRRGEFSTRDNQPPLKSNPTRYAAHTKGFNSHAIGLSVCSMFDAAQATQDFGKFPMLESQWNAMTSIAAQLCKQYSIAVTPQTVLGHGEVEENTGATQDNKWDPMVLPWDTSLNIEQVGILLRDTVEQKLSVI